MVLFSISLEEILFTDNFAAVFLKICVCYLNLMNGRAGFPFLSIEGGYRDEYLCSQDPIGEERQCLLKEGPRQVGPAFLVVLKVLVQQV